MNVALRGGGLIAAFYEKGQTVKMRFSKQTVAMAQAVYYTPSGVWPIVHIRSFEWLTGPKTDRWLVKTVGALITVSGAAIGMAAARDRITPEIELLAVGTAFSLAAVDVVYVAKGRIRPVYLLDAVVNLTTIAAYISTSRDASRPDSAPLPM